MSTDQYTPDELAFLDKAMVGIANAGLSDPELSSLNAEWIAKEALVLLEARRKIRGPAKALDEAGARRLERLDPFYALVSKLVGMVGDNAANYTVEVLTHLEGNIATMKHRGSRLVNMGLENDALKKRVKELEAKLAATPAASIANDEPICNENVIRGAYFWSGHVSSPVDNLALMNKSTMTFASIAKQLKLETSDIVEIRVIERADR